MQILIWILRIVLFLVLFMLSIKNDGAVTVYGFLGTQWHTPLIVLILVIFVAGALLGATSTVATVIAQRLEIKKLRKELDRLGSARKPLRPDLDNNIPSSL